MRNLIVILPFLMLWNMISVAQTSDFDIIKSEQPGEVIYKGTCTFQDISTISAFNLEENANGYKPDKEQVAILEKNLTSYQLIIFLGTWCEDSHSLIPKLYRVLKDVKYPLTTIPIYALDRSKQGKGNMEKIYDITNVPTIIVLKNGTEQGRITETVRQSIEQDLATMITHKN